MNNSNMSAKSIIEDLLETPFSARSFSEKLLIVEHGRPCPKLSSKLKSVHADRKRAYTRHFNENQYTLYPWLAGCENKAKLFCWPCVLFSRANSPWNSTGVTNLNALQSAQKKHKQSISHLQCVLMLASFSEKRVDEALSMQIRELNSQHNLQVKKNREVLKRLIDVTCFLANQELLFRGHDESANSLNRGNYIELLNLLKRYDSTLAEHFQTATVFKGMSMTIQNNLIKSVGELLKSHICKQLELSEFVAIMLDDESSDIQMKSQLSVVFRYCLKGKIHETFVGFIDVSNGRSAEDVFKLVKTLLQKYDVMQKLVAQTYDGAAVMSGHINELQTKVRDLCPNALFVHCYAHVLNLVLSQGLSSIRECKIFFSTLNGIATFSSHSCKKTHCLKEYLKRKIPSLAATRWCFSSRLVNVVHTYRNAILEFFDGIKNADSVWESKDRMAAHGYNKFLKSFETVFMLNVFSKLFTHSDTLFNTLQSENIDIIFCVNQINKFVSFLRKQRKEGFLEVWQCTSEAVQTPVQNEMNYQFDLDKTTYKKLFYEIVDNLIMQISERFSSFEKLKYFDLLNGKNFVEEKNNFPDSIVSNLIESYKDIFEYSQLKNELIVLYSSTEAIRHYVNSVSMGIEGMASTSSKNITPYNVLSYIENKNINTSFEQVYKLSNLICTIPATTVPIEHTFSALKRIKTYHRSTQGQERLSFLALLSIEKEMLSELRSSNDFYDRVIENFISVEQHVDFMYI